MRVFITLFALTLFPMTGPTNAFAATKGKAPAKATAPAKAGPPMVAQNTIALTSPGKAPHKQLEYRFAAFKGVKMYVITKMTMRLRMQMGKTVRQSPPIPTPGLQVETTLRSKGTKANGKTFINGVITGIKVLPSVKASPMVIIQLRKALNKLKGMKMTYVFDKQGRLLRGGFRAPKGSSQQMRQILNNLKQNMQQIIVPLPAKPIGIGAKWTAAVNVAKPIKLRQATVYTLKSLSNGTANIGAQMTQRAKSQFLNSQSPYGPVRNHIHFLRTRANGSSQIGLTRLFIRTKTRGLSKMKISVTVRKNTRTIDFNMDMRNGIRAGK